MAKRGAGQKKESVKPRSYVKGWVAPRSDVRPSRGDGEQNADRKNAEKKATQPNARADGSSGALKAVYLREETQTDMYGDGERHQGQGPKWWGKLEGRGGSRS